MKQLMMLAGVLAVLSLSACSTTAPSPTGVSAGASTGGPVTTVQTGGTLISRARTDCGPADIGVGRPDCILDSRGGAGDGSGK